MLLSYSLHELNPKAYMILSSLFWETDVNEGSVCTNFCNSVPAASLLSFSTIFEAIGVAEIS
jgi:hypothetical protein